MSPIKAVVFDFGGVLCFHPSAEKIAQAAEMAGVPTEDFDRALWTNRLEYDAGRVEPEDYWREVAALAGSQSARVLESLVNLDAELWNRFDERVLAWVRTLRERGLGTAILSNLPRPLGEALKARSGFLEHFDHITFSYELRLVKPEAAIYRHAVEGLGVRAAEALFLDDRPRNIEGALEAGLQAELFASWEQFVGERVPMRYGLPSPALAEALRQ